MRAWGGRAPRLARVLQNRPKHPPPPQTAVRPRADWRTTTPTNGFEQELWLSTLRKNVNCAPPANAPTKGCGWIFARLVALRSSLYKNRGSLWLIFYEDGTENFRENLYFSASLIFRPYVFLSPSPHPKCSLFWKLSLKKSISSGREIPDYRKMDTEKRFRETSPRMVSGMT